jgi:hypothetical protein
MKSKILVTLFTAALIGCGGGSSDSSSSNPYDVVPGGISNTASTNYSNGLKSFVETFRGLEFLLAMNDLAAFAGNSGNCASGGTISYTGTTQTLTKCVRRYPGHDAYTGSYTVTTRSLNATSSSFVISGVSTINATDPVNTSIPGFTIQGNGTLASSIDGTQTVTSNSETTVLTKGTLSVLAGVSSTYEISNPATSTLNDGTSVIVSPTSINSGFKIKKFPVTAFSGGYAVSILQPLKQIGDNFLSAGSYVISNTVQSTAAPSVGLCTQIQVDFLGANKFKLTCDGDSVTKNWNDADIVAARAASKQ